METIFSRKYHYDGIQNIQFDDNAPMIYLKDIGNRVYIDVKFENYGTYEIYAEIDFNSNPSVNLQTGIIYPGFVQHPKKLLTSKIILNKKQYNLIGKITLMESEGLTQPIFIRNATVLQNRINIKNIKIVGLNKIDYVYTEWWNKENNTGKRPYQHANHIVSNSIFSAIDNPRHMYREMIVLKWHLHTYATAINGPSTYMGIDFREGRIVFSVWNSMKDNKETPNKITFVGENVESNKFDHEGSGSYFTLRYNKYNTIPLTIGDKYGFYIHYNEIEDMTEYSAYFINLGPLDKPFENPKWILIGKVLHYNTYKIENRIGGFLENFMTANGHLFQRSVVLGNGWVSRDGKDWVSSSHEEAVLDDLNMQQAKVFNKPEDGFITCNTGGRLGMKDENLMRHGNLRTYDIYRDISKENMPSHLKNILLN